ncbi:MAG TPA: hypothetical protein VIY52_07095 [Streptosporangiaceae bacterium]
MDADEIVGQVSRREAGAVGSGADAAGAMLAEFGGWLAGERGLPAVTVRCYAKQARIFLAGLPEPLEAALGKLDAGQVSSFMLGYCQGRNTWSAKALVTALRALLRFLHVSGRIPVSLDGAVPAVASWRLASLPRGLPAGEVEQLLGGPRTRKPDRPPPRHQKLSCGAGRG